MKKNKTIGELKSENRRLSSIVAGHFTSKALTIDDIVNGKRPVFVHSLVRARYADFWAIPLDDNSGVLGGRRGLYRYEDYGRTWTATSDEDLSEKGKL